MEIKEQKLLNKKTNEAFLVTKSKDIGPDVYTCIKRFIMKKDEVGAHSPKI